MTETDILDLFRRTGEPTALIRLAHEWACRYLELKRRQGKLKPLPGNRTSDLAWDCIAPLFERDADDRFVRLIPHLDAWYQTPTPDQERLFRFRGIVFQTVNDGLFELYRVSDKDLSNIIRNIKSAIAASGEEVRLIKRNRTAYVRFGPSPASGRPEMPPEFLLARLSARCAGSGEVDTPRLTAHVLDILTEQTGYDPIIRLTELALLFRELGRLLHPAEDLPDAEPQITSSEATSFVHRALSDLDHSHGSKWLSTGKCSAGDWSAIRSAMSDLLADYLNDPDDVVAYHRYLASHVPGLDLQGYLDRYRSKFEYLARVATRHLRNRLQQEFGRFREHAGMKGYTDK